MTRPSRLPTYFISHGGGPWPYMPEQLAGPYARLAASLRGMAKEQGAAPKAVLMVSAHWEEREFTVMGAPQPGMLYDYGGFPPHTYQVVYPAPGAPAVAARVQALLSQAGMPSRQDNERGFDHGTFSPMAVIYPEAQVPLLQLSLKRGLEPLAHIALGRALAPLREEGVLIVASGLSYHNLRAFGPAARGPSAAFDAWLQHTVVSASATDRVAGLLAWEAAPSARQAHPREEHLLPLMVAVGAAEQERGQCVYHEDDFVGGVAVSSFRFGDLAETQGG
jgi:aromatic ring-opening dioxygenase catalytic subunit (LigB family)